MDQYGPPCVIVDIISNNLIKRLKLKKMYLGTIILGKLCTLSSVAAL
jgi:hypothetical protein